MLNSIKKYSKTFFFKVLVGIIIMPFLELTQAEYNMILRNRQKNNYVSNNQLNNRSNYAIFPKMFSNNSDSLFDFSDELLLPNNHQNLLNNSFNPNSFFSSQQSIIKHSNGKKTKSKYYKKKISRDRQGYRVFEDNNGKKSNKLYRFKNN